MAPADNLSPAGSSSYSSDTMVVGDGTWDFTKNTFLLPNLVGLNFDTMQFNGERAQQPRLPPRPRPQMATNHRQAWATASPPLRSTTAW